MDTTRVFETPEQLAAFEHAEAIRASALSKNRWNNCGLVCCEFCRSVMKDGTATFGKLIPKSRGGTLSEENLIICCEACLNSRGNKLPFEWLQELQKMQADIHKELEFKFRAISRRQMEIRILESKLPEISALAKQLSRTLMQNPEMMNLEAPKEKTAA